ncbi:MFS transporter [Riemerella anatipestifer]|uniref:MFS transporter n=1 Tax=Riemerella anatipestifer TaxID=34085 RepID=UPI0021D59E0F|nr:MFS transporter [Riemerella anatipestifer]MCU7597248.1 MFS transporter [Riemerella anatipestifer]MCW0494547.1 MFS transporter [Riemerella anatipestifer]MCW0501940.1 MFS transporter [Riemerella anatipestifer]
MSTIRIKIALFLNYFVFAILLNSVGSVILQVQRNFDISKANASVLEGFKDLPIAIGSFILASFLPKIGIKKSMLIGLALVSLLCFLMPFSSSFWMFKLLFLIVGLSFALIKISVFTSIGLVTSSTKEHTSLMGFLEGFFMIGVLFGNLLFSFFIDDTDSKSLSWTNVYWILGTMSLVSFTFLWSAKFDESEAKLKSNSLIDDLKSSINLFKMTNVLIFLASAFLFVLVEQSFQTWTPTFYNEILKVPASMGIQAGAILAGAFALGRFLSGFFSQKFSWISIVIFCILGFTVSLLLVLPLTQNITHSENISWLNAPLVIYLFPLMGLFLSPIYPCINSIVLASTPKHLHSSMSGLIVVFSAIGGTIGSIITGSVFQAFSGQKAFYFSLLPLSLLLISVIAFNQVNKKVNS